jgi:hypothetical protein
MAIPLSGQEVKTPTKEKVAEKQPAPVAKTDTDEEQYVRIKDDETSKKPQAMQTAIVQYRGKPGTPFAGQIVDLFGVVHIGEKNYYEDVNQRLSTYEVVLYELVAPDGTRIRPEDLEERRGLLASIQTGMKDLLNLEYQLEKIDYMATNFRHADMSPEEFVEDMEKNDDSVVKMLARMLGAGIAAQASSGGDVSMMMAMMSEKDRPKNMKRAMAKQLIEMEYVTAGLNNANGENTLIKGRNTKAMSILKDELQAGKKTAAVFYGAGHLADMADRLEKEFEMEEVQTTWLDAWDLTTN